MATLEFNYAEQIAIIGPLQLQGNPHRWDLCEEHARRTTVPQGWTLELRELTPEGIEGHADADEEDLMALVEAMARGGDPADDEAPEPAPRLVRREHIPLPTGRHPARKNLPSSAPRRHLRAVRGQDS